MLYYDIDKTELYGLVDAEVSQVADAAYGEDGTPLYDSVELTSKDDDIVEALLDDGIAQFVRTSSDIASLGEHTSGTGSSATSVDAIVLDVPDFNASDTDAAVAQITRFIVLCASAALFQQRRAALVPEYTNRAQAALDNAVAIIRKRTAPTRS